MTQDVRGAETSGQFTRRGTWTSAPQGPRRLYRCVPEATQLRGEEAAGLIHLLHAVIVGRAAPSC